MVCFCFCQYNQPKENGLYIFFFRFFSKLSVIEIIHSPPPTGIKLDLLVRNCLKSNSVRGYG